MLNIYPVVTDRRRHKFEVNYSSNIIGFMKKIIVVLILTLVVDFGLSVFVYWDIPFSILEEIAITRRDSGMYNHFIDFINGYITPVYIVALIFLYFYPKHIFIVMTPMILIEALSFDFTAFYYMHSLEIFLLIMRISIECSLLTCIYVMNNGVTISPKQQRAID